MEVKHTPGPWEVTQINCLGDEVEYGNVRPVSRHMFGHETSLAIADLYLLEMPEQRANAHLIAAAPDLLEALEALEQAADSMGNATNCGMCDEALSKARAAIAKSKGEAQ